MLIVFGILAGAVGLLAWGRPRVDIVAILVATANLVDSLGGGSDGKLKKR